MSGGGGKKMVDGIGDARLEKGMGQCSEGVE